MIIGNISAKPFTKLSQYSVNVISFSARYITNVTARHTTCATTRLPVTHATTTSTSIGIRKLNRPAEKRITIRSATIGYTQNGIALIYAPIHVFAPSACTLSCAKNIAPKYAAHEENGNITHTGEPVLSRR